MKILTFSTSTGNIHLGGHLLNTVQCANPCSALPVDNKGLILYIHKSLAQRHGSRSIISSESACSDTIFM